MGKFNKHVSLVLLAFVFAFSVSSQTYCYPTFTGGSSNLIQQVSVGGLYHLGNATAGNFTLMRGSINAGDTIQMIVTTPMASFPSGVAVFIDLNNDFDMTDSGEMLYSNKLSSSTNHVFDITVPDTTIPGLHRLRVIANIYSSIIISTPCGGLPSVSSYHDYTLEVKNNCPKDSNMQVFNITDTSAQFSWASRSGIGYEYVISNDTLDPVGVGTFTSSNAYSTNGLTPGIRYNFHLRTSCGSRMYSPWEHISFIACSSPNAQINLSGDVRLCRGDTLSLSVPLDSNYSYQWYMNGIKLNGKTNNFLDVAIFAAKYFVVVTTFPGCKSTSDVANVSIHDKPKIPPSLSVNHITLTTGGFATYEWYLNGNIISGSTDSTHTATVNGKYYVIGIDSNGCSATSNSVDVVGVGLQDHNYVSGVSIFPNPATNRLYISSGREIRVQQVQIRDQMGRLVGYPLEEKQINEIDISGLVQGVYLIHILFDNGLRSQHRFLKVNN